MLVAQKSLISAPQAIPWTSEPIYLGQVINYAIQLEYLSTGCTIKLQCSCDAGDPLTVNSPNRGYNIVNWSDISDSITTITANGDLFFDVHDSSYTWVRIVAIGSGSITSAIFNTKGI